MAKDQHTPPRPPHMHMARARPHTLIPPTSLTASVRRTAVRLMINDHQDPPSQRVGTDRREALHQQIKQVAAALSCSWLHLTVAAPSYDYINHDNSVKIVLCLIKTRTWAEILIKETIGRIKELEKRTKQELGSSAAASFTG